MKKQFAIALYANQAESEDELTFKKNDILQLLQLNYLGMEGWWLCKLLKSNKTGLAAGNRLKLVQDEKTLLKINSILSSHSTRTSAASTNNSSSIISGSSSTCSVLSSNSSNTSSVSIDSASTSSSIHRMQALSLTDQAPKSIDSSSNSGSSSIQHQQDTGPVSVTKPKFVLPAKLKTRDVNLPPSLKNNCKTKTSFLTKSTEDILSNQTQTRNTNDSNEGEDDDYDYDIPANYPILAEPSPATKPGVETSCSRKSTSPTIDSGISTSSLASYDAIIALQRNTPDPSSRSPSKTADDSTSSTSSDSFSSGGNNSTKSNIQSDFNNQIEQFNTICTQLKTSPSDLTVTRGLLFNLKGLLYEFLVSSLKRMKEEHACFHPNLNIFNKFKTYYRQIKEFYLYFETTLSTITNVYQWQSEILKKTSGSNELDELLGKLEYFDQLIKELDQLVEQTELFSYHSEISITKYQQHKVEKNRVEEEDQDYEYEYDNNNNNIVVESQRHEGRRGFDIYERIDNDVDNDDYSDYCQIDEESNEVDSNSDMNIDRIQKNVIEEVIYSNCNIRINKSKETAKPVLPVYNNDNNNDKLIMSPLIKREIKIVPTSTSNAPESQKITMADQMLLKFYLKHIEENLSELNMIYEGLMNKLKHGDSIENDLKEEEGSGHKLAINGHKLVFVCDTLERNLHSTHLKAALDEVSGNLCEALKLYMIRIKTTSLQASTPPGKQRTLIMESLGNVLSCSNKLKQIIIKYYFKSY